MLEKKDYVSVSKGVNKKNFATCKSLCNLQELYTAFKEKHPNINICFLKVLYLQIQMVYSGRLKNDSLCLGL